MTTLIIGCGYLGGRLGAMLRRSGERVFGTVRSVARGEQIATAGIEPVIADVLDPTSLHVLPAADRVFYCVGFDRTAGSSMREVYVDGLRNVLEHLPRRVTRLVYASSTGVFGQRDGELVDEHTPPCPHTESGRICLEAEERLRDWTETRAEAMIAVTLRFAGLYGPGRVVRRGLIERGDPIPGDPTKLFNLVQVEDAAAAALKAMFAASPEPVYLISDDRPVTRLEYYSLVARLLNVPAPTFAPPDAGSSAAGRDATSKRVVNERMKAGLGVKLIYPDVTSGLPASI